MILDIITPEEDFLRHTLPAMTFIAAIIAIIASLIIACIVVYRRCSLRRKNTNT